MSARVIEFTEWGDGAAVPLTAAECVVLQRLGDRLRVRWTGDREAWVAPRDGAVGIASLSPETTIVVRPKWPIRSLLELTAYAYEVTMPPLVPGEAASLDRTGPQNWLALLLTIQVEELLAQGIRQGYREVEDELPYVRGQIAFSAFRPARERTCLIPCRFSDFVLDTVENRIIRGTLELLSTAPLIEEVRRRLLDTLRAFAQVSLQWPSAPMFDRVSLDRLNLHYRPALEICRLVIEGVGVELTPGSIAGSAFFFSTHEVFERALFRAFHEAAPRETRRGGQYGERIRVLEGGPPWSVYFQPDIILGPREVPWLVADAKYKRPTVEHREAERFLSGDLYQALTYAAALRAPVVLVYPQVDEAVEAVLALGEHQVTVRTADIGHCGVTGLRDLAHELVAARRTSSQSTG